MTPAALWRKLLARDPHGHALRRAVRAAVVVPVDFAIGSQLVGNAQVATFAAFGSFALLLFVEFPGSRLSRLTDYGLLALTGAALITLGTLVATPDWLAVLVMGVVAFAVLFAGAISSVTAASGRAALLTFILPVMLPGTTSDIPARLAGWGIAVAVSVPVAVLLWPPDEQNALRVRTAELCRALAAMLHLEQPPPGRGDPLVAVLRALGTLREAFRASAVRPVALSTGSRLLMRLVDELEWLTTAVTNACADAPEQWPEQGRRLRDAASATLRAAGEVLAHDGDGPQPRSCVDLDRQIAALDETRAAVAEETLAALRRTATVSAGGPAAPAGEFDRPLYAAHELGYTVGLAGRTVAGIAAADSRPWLAKLAGRRPSIPELGALAAAERIASGHLDRRSVWLQNSIRGAVGLALAVLLARISGNQQGFWIVLGALSVLRSNALSTGATVVRALGGTLVGFAVGGALLAVIGTNHAVLWPILPVAILLAAFAPDAISFAAGQAGFTLVVIILFNIIAPAGWRIGVLRIEDVALGCAASLVAGALFWPRGAAAALGAALADGYRSAAGYLEQSVEHVAGRRADPPDAGIGAEAAGWRLDDALRQYLAERGAKHVPLESVTALANGASRLRLAGTAVSRLRAMPPDSVDERLAAPIGVLTARAEQVTDWYVALADELSGRDADLPALDAGTGSFLEVVLPAVDQCGDAERAARAERLLWSGQYLGDVDRMRADLLRPADQVRVARRRGRLPWTGGSGRSARVTSPTVT